MPGKILVDITPLRESRDFRLLFTGQLISMLGTQLTVVAIPYQVYRLTHSTLQVGAISLAQLVPFIVGALLAGPLGDSMDRRRIMLWTTVRHGAHQRAAGRQRLGCTTRRSWPSISSAPWPPRFNGISNTARMASVPGLVRAAAHFGRRRHDADHLPGGHGRRPRPLGPPPGHRPPARLRHRCRHLRGGALWPPP